MSTTAQQRYPSDLTDIRWANIEHLLPRGNGRAGRPRSSPLRETVDAIPYPAKGGCSWRMPPHDSPPWEAVSSSFDTRPDTGVWERVRSALRAEIRGAAGTEPTPSLA